MSAALSVLCLLAVVAYWAWLSLSARQLRQRTIKLRRWPPLPPLYYAALASMLRKPRRWRDSTSVQEQQITVGAPPRRELCSGELSLCGPTCRPMRPVMQRLE